MASLNGEPRNCPRSERHAIEQNLIRFGEELNSRPDDYKPEVGGIFPDGSLYCPWTFLAEIHNGTRYGHNPFLADLRQLPWLDQEHTQPNPSYRVPHRSWMSNYRCWREITDAQICEVFYYGENPDLPNPRLHDMLMRSEHDFYGGSVQDFSPNWIRFAHLIDDERYLDKVYESVNQGVDFLDFSKKVPRQKAGRFRPGCYVYSKAYHHLEYCLRYKGSKTRRKRIVDNFLNQHKGKIRKRDGKFITKKLKKVPYTSGYYPVRRQVHASDQVEYMICPQVNLYFPTVNNNFIF